LQLNVIKQLSSTGRTAEEVAHELGADPEDVFHILHHLAANDRGVRMDKGQEPADERFSISTGQK
jgi:hypothetical protein